MATTLAAIGNFEITVRGKVISLWQGVDDDGTITDPMMITVDGDCHHVPFTLLTATAVTIWDDDDDKPADFDFFFFVATQNMFIQVINSATSWTIPHLAGVPFFFAPKTDGLTAKSLGAASTTPMSGSAPSVTEVDSIVIQNNSGNTAYGFAFLVD